MRKESENIFMGGDVVGKADCVSENDGVPVTAGVPDGYPEAPCEIVTNGVPVGVNEPVLVEVGGAL
jgi:hypothetical protein